MESQMSMIYYLFSYNRPQLLLGARINAIIFGQNICFRVAHINNNILQYSIQKQQKMIEKVPQGNPSPSPLLAQLIAYSQRNSLLTKFDAKYIAEALTIRQLQEWSRLFEGHGQRQGKEKGRGREKGKGQGQAKLQTRHSLITLEQFVAIFGTGVGHSKEETIFLMLSLMDMYGEIRKKSRQAYDSQSIQYSLISDYLCEKIINNEQNTKLQLRAQEQDPNTPEPSPPIWHLYPESLPFLCHSQSRQKPLQAPIKCLEYSKKLDRILSLTSFSTRIEFYSRDLKLRGAVSPRLDGRYKSEPVITAFAYSRLEGRIGCIVRGVDLLFWEARDGFQTEKLVEGVNADRIYFLDAFAVWATIKGNTMTIWDLQHEREHYHITIPQATQITCVTQIPKLRSILLSSSSSQAPHHKSLHMYQLSPSKALPVFHTQLPPSGCHTLHLDPGTQSILQLGYTNVVAVWQYDGLTYQLGRVGQLVGHRGIVVAVESVGLQGDATVLCTADDRGWLRVWDLRGLRCLQAVRVATGEIRRILSIGDQLLIGDNRLSMVPVDRHPQQNEHSACTAVLHSNSQQKLYLLTGNSCKMASLQTGKVSQIFRLCPPEQQILSTQKLKNSFAFATNKGNIILVDRQFSRRRVVNVCQAEVGLLRSDQGGNWLLSLGGEADGRGTMGLWVGDQACGDGLVPCKRITGLPLGDSSRVGLEVSADHCFIALCCREREIHIIDFQSFKHLQTLWYPQEIGCHKFHPRLPLLLTSLKSNKILITPYSKSKSSHKFQPCPTIECPKYRIFTCTDHRLQQQQQQQEGEGEQRQGNFVTHMLVNGEGRLVCVGSDRGVAVYDLGGIVDVCAELEAASDKDDNGRKNQSNLFRPVQQTFQISHKQPHTIQPHSITYLPLIKQKPPLNCRKVLQIENPQKQMLLILGNDGIINLLHSGTLESLGLRKGHSTAPEFWTETEVCCEVIKRKIVQAIRLNQKIHRTVFREELKQHIDLDKLNIQIFLSSLLARPNSNSKLPHRAHPKPLTHSKHHSVFEPNQTSLKAMQTEKRLRKSSCLEEHHQPSFKVLAMGRRINESIKAVGNGDNPMKDPFFLQPVQQRFSLNRDREEDCQLFFQINQKFQKWKTEKKNRSLPALNPALAGTNLNKFMTAKNLEKLPLKLNKQKQKQRNSELKQNLKHKIQSVFGRKDKKLDLLKKIFKKQYNEAIRQK